MTDTPTQQDRNHGQTVWLKTFDSEGFALYGCSHSPRCDHVMAINPYAAGSKKFKIVSPGPDVEHQTSLTAECATAAFELGVWTPGVYGELGLEALRGSGGGMALGAGIKVKDIGTPEPKASVH